MQGKVVYSILDYTKILLRIEDVEGMNIFLEYATYKPSIKTGTEFIDRITQAYENYLIKLTRVKLEELEERLKQNGS